MDHPFKREMVGKVGNEYREFDYHYFDDPQALTGFRGFREDGNAAEGRRDFAREAKDIASIPGINTFLDVGCAKGYLVKQLRELGITAYGIDISDYAIDQAPADVRPYLRQLKVQDLGVEERYDIVHTNGVLLYLTISEVKSALSCFSRIANLGVVIIEPTREQFTVWYDKRDVFAIDLLRKQELSQNDWDTLIEGAGFRKNGAWYKKERCR